MKYEKKKTQNSSADNRRDWIKDVILPIVLLLGGSGGILAIYLQHRWSSTEHKPEQNISTTHDAHPLLQSGERRLVPMPHPPNPCLDSHVRENGTVETCPCFDNMNKAEIRCRWLQFEVPSNPKGSLFTVAFTIDTDFTLSPPPENNSTGPQGKYDNSNDCSGTPGTTDRWRGGWVRVSCNDGSEGENVSWPAQGPGFDLEVKHTLTGSATCKATGLPTEIRLDAIPRGCSSMQVTRGRLTYSERQE